MLSGIESLSVPTALLVAFIGFLMVFIILVILALFVKLLSAIIDSMQHRTPAAADSTAAIAEPAASVPSGDPLPETESAGALQLVDTDEATAAMIMAIVSEQSGIPLNRLAFRSIKCVDNGGQTT